MTTAIRFDKGTVTKVIRSKEGFLTVRGVATRTGVFPYPNVDGTTRFELRHPDDILSEESLETLGGKPTTLEHPPGLVTAENAAQYATGSVNNRVHVVGDGLIEVVFNVHRKDAIDAIERGDKRQLSCGYRCDVIEESGVFNGEPYTHRQKNVVYNHLAVVRKARAGEIASIHFDCADVACQECSCDHDFDHDSVNTKPNLPEPSHMATIQIDNVTYSDVSESLAGIISAKIKRLDSVEADLAKISETRADAASAIADLEQKIVSLTAERDRELGRADGLELDLDDLTAQLQEALTETRADSETAAPGLSDEEIEAKVQVQVKERVDAMDGARQIMEKLTAQGINVPEIKLDASMDSQSIKTALVSALNPGVTIAPEEVSGLYRSLTLNGVRSDSVSAFHADALDEALNASVRTGGKNNKPAKGEIGAGDKKRMDNASAPLTMSKR